MSGNKTVLVTGANGFVGSYVCQELLANGYTVRGLHRASSNTESIDQLNLQKFVGDICNPEDLRPAMEGVDAVIHIAALFRQAKHPDSVYRDINIEGVRNVLDVAIEMGVKRVVHCSTVGVHSHIPNPPANEEEEYRPGDIYQETKCEGEQVALSYFKAGKIPGVVIRPAMIWGPGDTRTLKLFKGIARRRFPLIGTGKTLVHWVMVPDLARAFRQALEQHELNGEVYIIAGERAVPMEYMISEIAKAFAVKPPPFKIPAFPIQLLGSIVETICIPFGIEPPIYRRRVDFFTKTRAFDSSKAKADLGYQPDKTFEEEVESIAAWYREHGWV
ncbi:NAD-dependent epimerase/dehydratase family protein [Oligoflexia bacterium]|nr:NAD-dependent epimerase/dehydratase family protein [Oligoflexia bacterium]